MTILAVLLVTWPLIVILLVLVTRRGRRARAAAEAAEADRQEQQYLSTLTHEQRVEYLLARGPQQQAEATGRAGLGIAAVIGFGGFDHE